MAKLGIVRSIREERKKQLFGRGCAAGIQMRESELALFCVIWLQGVIF